MELFFKYVADEDIPLVLEWMHRPHVARWWSDPQSWLREIRGRYEDFDWIDHFIVQVQDQPLGFAQYYDCARSAPDSPWSGQPQGTYGIDFFIGEPHWLGQGLGKALVARLGDLAVSKAKARRLLADPVPENLVSIKTLQANGYRLEEASGLYIKDVS